jgi:hypothetical protein
MNVLSPFHSAVEELRREFNGGLIAVADTARRALDLAKEAFELMESLIQAGSMQ